MQRREMVPVMVMGWIFRLTTQQQDLGLCMCLRLTHRETQKLNTRKCKNETDEEIKKIQRER